MQTSALTAHCINIFQMKVRFRIYLFFNLKIQLITIIYIKNYGLHEKYVRIFQAFFNETMSAVRVNGEMSDWFSVNSGTGQDDIQGPPVFNFCLNFGIFLAEVHKAISHGAVVVLQKELKGADEKVVMNSD